MFEAHVLAENSLIAFSKVIGSPTFLPNGLDSYRSACSAPFRTWNNVELYRGFPEKCSVLLTSLLSIHPLIDGNKRLAFITLGYYITSNGYRLNTNNGEIYWLLKSIASNTISQSEILEFFVKYLTHR